MHLLPWLAAPATLRVLIDYDAAEHDGHAMEIARGLSEAFSAEFRSAHGLVVSTGELAEPAKEVRLRVKA